MQHVIVLVLTLLFSFVSETLALFFFFFCLHLLISHPSIFELHLTVEFYLPFPRQQSDWHLFLSPAASVHKS